jgi:hypothetical protein
VRDEYDFGDLVLFPADIVAKAERDADYRRRERVRMARNKKPHKDAIPYRERSFVFWDGEGPKDAGYALFGNSLGNEICHPFLSTVECLDLILQTEIETPKKIHVGFGLNYDVSMILKDLSWRHLSALKNFGRTTWKDYDLEYVPRHWFRIKSRGLDVKLFDVVSFFATDFVGALRNFRIRTNLCLHGQDRCQNECHCFCVLCHIETEKKRRSSFVYSQIDGVRKYMRYELELGAELMNVLRTVFLDAGFDVHSWHGPGALARMALNRHKIKNAMCQTPSDVRIAARYAFAGGRFEMIRAGYFQRKVYNADINSAYPYFAAMLPNLDKGSWRRTRDYEVGKFAVYYIEYQSPQQVFEPYALFRRYPEGHVAWPNRVSGWFWNPEAAIVAEDRNAKFIEGWVFDEWDSTDRPFAFILDYYNKRRILKSAGNAAEFTFKLIINSIYGQLAQRTGWDKKNKQSPRFHQLEWAGWITSACRAEVWKVAKQCGNDLISIDTDGLYSLSPIPVTNVGSNLGQWELAEYESGIFWQSGIYALSDGASWSKAKTRGIPKGSYSAEQMIASLKANQPLRMTRTSFIGFGLALNGQRQSLNTWSSEDSEFVFGGQGKRYHNTRGCKNQTTCQGDVHGLIPVPRAVRPKESVESVPHYLPWLDNAPAYRAVKEDHFDWVAFNRNDLDEDDAWLLTSITGIG